MVQHLLSYPNIIEAKPKGFIVWEHLLAMGPSASSTPAIVVVGTSTTGAVCASDQSTEYSSEGNEDDCVFYRGHREFTCAERNIMVQHLLSYPDIVATRPKGLIVWEELLATGAIHNRSADSLRGHYTSHILPRIDLYFRYMTEEQKTQFKFLQQLSPRIRRMRNICLNRHREFTCAERNIMVQHLLSYPDIVATRPKGLIVWEELLATGAIHNRSADSLRGHYTSHILPRINLYFRYMTEEQKTQFHFLQQSSPRIRRMGNTCLNRHREFTCAERNIMVQHLLSYPDIVATRPKGLIVWEELLATGAIHNRSADSLRGHYTSHILPRINLYFRYMTEEQKTQFHFLQQSSPRIRRMGNTCLNRHREFTCAERNIMVQHLLSYPDIVATRPKGLIVWEELLATGAIHNRSADSLRGHYTSHILPRIDLYFRYMTEEQKTQFKFLQQLSPRIRRMRNICLNRHREFTCAERNIMVQHLLSYPDIVATRPKGLIVWEELLATGAIHNRSADSLRGHYTSHILPRIDLYFRYMTEEQKTQFKFLQQLSPRIRRMRNICLNRHREFTCAERNIMVQHLLSYPDIVATRPKGLIVWEELLATGAIHNRSADSLRGHYTSHILPRINLYFRYMTEEQKTQFHFLQQSSPRIRRMGNTCLNRHREFTCAERNIMVQHLLSYPDIVATRPKGLIVWEELLATGAIHNRSADSLRGHYTSHILPRINLYFRYMTEEQKTQFHFLQQSSPRIRRMGNTCLNRHREFTCAERNIMVQHLLSYPDIVATRPKGLIVWEELLATGAIHNRSADSLRGHYTSHILPRINLYFRYMTEEQKTQFHFLQQSSPRIRRMGNTCLNRHREFTCAERNIMVQHLLSYPDIVATRPKGLIVWEELLATGAIHNRSADSLRGHYTSHILPRINLYFRYMTEEQKTQFHFLQQLSPRIRRMGNTCLNRVHQQCNCNCCKHR